MLVYRIKNSEDKYSSGGVSPKFSKKGKIWTSRSHFTNHLLKFSRGRNPYKDCSVEVSTMETLKTFPHIGPSETSLSLKLMDEALLQETEEALAPEVDVIPVETGELVGVSSE